MQLRKSKEKQKHTTGEYRKTLEDTGTGSGGAPVGDAGETQKWRGQEGAHRLYTHTRTHIHTRLTANKTQVDTEKGWEIKQWEELKSKT